jgi:hypothetical protein
MSRRDRDDYGDGPDEEPTPVEWDVTGNVGGVCTQHYIKATSAEAAEEKFRERYWDCDVIEVYACLSDYQ